jgi:hypothetical protein
VTYNTFKFTVDGVGNDCSPQKGCGFNAMFSIFGTTSPYRGWTVPRDISDDQDNHFAHNSYFGPWRFMAANQGVVVSQSKWTKGFTDTGDGSDIHFNAQDARSTFKP